MQLPHTLSEQPRPDIFRMSFEGQVPLQEGRYLVVAYDLDEAGEQAGGGAIANFTTLDAADRCYEQIMNINAAHEPKIVAVDWETDESKELRSAAIDNIRERATEALRDGRVIKRNKKK